MGKPIGKFRYIGLHPTLTVHYERSGEDHRIGLRTRPLVRLKSVRAPQESISLASQAHPFDCRYPKPTSQLSRAKISRGFQAISTPKVASPCADLVSRGRCQSHNFADSVQF